MNFCTAAAFIGMNLCADQDAVLVGEQRFMEHMAAHGLSFGTQEEYKYRFNLFAAKDAEIKEINADVNNTFTVGHNQFSTWTKDETKRLMGYKGQSNLDTETKEFEPVTMAEVDWRQKGYTIPVQDQGHCGSCWAFAATATVEAHHQIATGQLMKLSEMQLVNCETIYSRGCQGGLPDKAFEYLGRYPQEQAVYYPYYPQDGQCRYQPAMGQVAVSNYYKVQPYSVAQLKAAISQGPVSVIIQADQDVFMHYQGGVINSAQCGTQLDHAVTAIGYGNENGQDYYIVRNSWNAGWGEAGHVRIAAVEGQGICGIQMEPSWPVTN